MTARRPSRAAHVFLAPGNRLQCLHCGGTHELGASVEILVMHAAAKAFEKTHKGCKRPAAPRCAICLELGHAFDEHVRIKVLFAEDWPGCGDEGTSSTAIFHHMQGHGVGERCDSPRDASDFARCARLLAAPWAAGWRARMGEMDALPGWNGIGSAWEELDAIWAVERLNPDGRASRLYERLQELRGER